MMLAECKCEGRIQAMGWWWGSRQPTLWHLWALRGPGAGDALSLPEVFVKVAQPPRSEPQEFCLGGGCG